MAANPYPNIGWNPVPGIPAEVTKLQQKVAAAATALENTHRQLTKLTGESSYWEGDAADKFRESIEGDLTKYIKDAASSLRSAATHLHRWDGHLTSNRELAKKYDAAMAEKQAAAEKAKGAYDQAARHPDLKLADQTFPSQEEADAATTRLRAAERDLNEASVAVTKANSEYESLDRKVKELEVEHTSEAETIAKALDGATKDAPDEPGFWDKVGDVLLSVGEFLAEHAGTIGAIAGLLALFPPLAPFMAPIALVASAVSMGKNVIYDEGFRQNLMFQGSKMEIFSAYASLAGDAVGMIPGGKALGLAAKEGFESAADGANLASKTWAGAKGGLLGIGRSALDDANAAWSAAGASTKGSALLMADIHVNGLNVAANVISSSESLGAVEKDGSEHNTAEGTKAAATAHGIAGLLGLV
ncbi:putative T7SS-secreted protein [Streptomyces sp. NPDC098781]|uniref:putative T7SS-secreted protein n=1 Tax=Streptomyces sp. NPDC098781 TaxID=3366097 RepID=UPI003829C5B2